MQRPKAKEIKEGAPLLAEVARSGDFPVSLRDPCGEFPPAKLQLIWFSDGSH